MITVAPVPKLPWREIAEVRRVRNFCISVVESREGLNPEIMVVIFGTPGGADEVARLPAYERHAIAKMTVMAEAIADTIELVGSSWLGDDEMAKPPTF